MKSNEIFLNFDVVWQFSYSAILNDLEDLRIKVFLKRNDMDSYLDNKFFISTINTEFAFVMILTLLSASVFY